MVFHNDLVIDGGANGLVENELSLAGFRNFLANIRNTLPGRRNRDIRRLANWDQRFSQKS